MVDRVIDIITPATSFDLISLDELKIMFGIDTSDTSQDTQLSQYITYISDVISTFCNRTFAYEEVAETWTCVNMDETNAMKRLFVSHYPLDPGYAIVVQNSSVGVFDPSTYVTEIKSGKIELLGGCPSEPITVQYAGGYESPDDVPPALKQAAAIMIRETMAMMQRFAVGGIRSISHKDSRVMYYDINQMLAKGPLGGVGLVNQLANNLLMKYIRLEV